MRDGPTLVGLGALTALIVVGPQLMGGRDGWGISILAVVAGVAVLGSSIGLRDAHPTHPLSFAWVVAFGLIGWTCFQAAPLPRGLTAMLQPEAVSLSDAAAGLLGDEPSRFISLSLSPYGTQREIVKLLAAVCAFMSGWMVALSGRRTWVVTAVAISTGVMALVGLFHVAAGLDEVFGIVEQVLTASQVPAPLLNSNHLGGFLAMGVPLAIGLALAIGERRKRLGWLVLGVLVGATSLLCLSRGAVASLGAGVVLLGLFGLIKRRGQHGALLAIAATTAVTGALGLYVAAEAIFRDFESGNLSKLELSAQGLGLALEHPWVGVGRGAFSAAFVAEHGLDRRFTHPENFLAQWTSEWGLLVGVTLAVLLAIGLFRALRRAKGWVALGGFAAIVSIVVHDLVDFAMEGAAVACVVAALFGSLLAPSRVEPYPGRAPRQWMGGAAVGAMALAAVALVGWRLDARDTWRLQDELITRLESDRTEAFQELLVTAFRLHPSEPAFPLLAGAEAARRNDPAAIPWLNRAMVLASGWSAPHLEAARYLARRGRLAQAFLEVRAAEERRVGSATGLACALVRSRPEAASLLIHAARDDEVGLRVLDQVTACIPLDGEASRSIDRVLRAHHVVGARIRDARRALLANEPDRALRILEPIADRRDADIRLLWARSLISAGDPARAADALRGVETWADDGPSVLRTRAEALAAAGRAEQMRATLEALRGRAAGNAHQLAAAWVLQGQLEQTLDNDGRAMQAFERADRLDPSSAGLASVARLAESLGSLGRAHRAFADICQRDGASSASCADRDRVRARLGEPSPLVPQLPGAP